MIETIRVLKDGEIVEVRVVRRKKGEKRPSKPIVIEDEYVDHGSD